MLLAKGSVINYVFNGKEETITCTEVIENEHKVFGNLYKFDDETAMYEEELLGFFDLLNARGGYSIVK